MATVITKESDSIITTVDGVVTNIQSIRREDNVISTPSGSNLKIDLVYVNGSNQLVLMLEDDSEITISGLTGPEIVTLLEALGSGSRLSHTKLDDVGASDHHSKYTDAEVDTIVAVHAALATVHQDAPALILTHKGDASAHHSKYTDAEAVSSGAAQSLMFALSS